MPIAGLAPRATRVPPVRILADLETPALEELEAAIEWAASVAGPIRAVERFVSLTSRLARLRVDGGTLLLKACREPYRAAELEGEFHAFRLLERSPVPVPRPVAFRRSEGFAVLLREWVEGEPLTSLLPNLAGQEPVSHLPSPKRRTALTAMARALREIHRIEIAATSWDGWLDGCLETAESNLRHGVFDPAEFAEESPADARNHLFGARPTPGPVRLLHGDYRPKNLLARNGEIAAVIDWSFADSGDPAYDLAIALEVVGPGEEREAFLDEYGIHGDLGHRACLERIAYFERLVKFLNV